MCVDFNSESTPDSEHSVLFSHYVPCTALGFCQIVNTPQGKQSLHILFHEMCKGHHIISASYCLRNNYAEGVFQDKNRFGGKASMPLLTSSLA